MEKKLVVISGMSGAGKSTASVILEDMGYYCIDSYPIELLEPLMQLLKKDDNPKYRNVCLLISILDLEKYASLLDNSDLKASLILMDCEKETLINRYKFTRRVHPLMISNTVNNLYEAIDFERKIMDSFKLQSAFVIDTTHLSKNGMKEKLEKIMHDETIPDLTISFESFGFKHGAPSDGDIILDTRMLDNPFYDETLRPLTGNDQPVYDFVLSKKSTQEYLAKIIPWLDFVFQRYDNNERRHITVCIGCTGGQHRSVSIANYLYDHYKNTYLCYLNHRELREKE